MEKTTALILYISLFIGTSVLGAQNARIIGKVKNPSSYDISIRYTSNPVSGDNVELPRRLTAEGTFEAVLDITTPTMAFIEYEGKRKRIHVEPNDKIELEFDAAHFDWSFLFKGQGRAHNDFLKQFDFEFKEWTDNDLLFYIAQRSASNFRALMDVKQGEKWAFYNNFPDNQLFSKHFREYIQAEIDYWWAYNLLRYRWENPKANQKEGSLLLDKDYYSFLDAVFIQNESALPNLYYKKFLSEYLKYRQELGSHAVKNYAYTVTANSLSLRSEPEKGIIGRLANGEVVQYLKDRSETTSTMKIGGEDVTAYWLKVRTLDGKTGWAFKGGLEPTKNEESSEFKKIGQSERYLQAGKYLDGKTLEFFLASEMFAQFKADGGSSASKYDISQFLANSTSPFCLQAVGRINEVAFKEAAASPPSTRAATQAAAAQTATTTLPPAPTPQKKAPQPLEDLKTYPAAHQGMARISGVVKNAAFLAVTLKTYKDLVSKDENEFMLPLDGNNAFDLNFEMKQPGIVKLVYGFEEIELYIEPTDHLSVEIDGQAGLSTVVFKGRGSLHNEFLLRFHEAFKMFSDNYLYYEIANRSPMDYRMYVDDISRKRWEFYRDYPTYKKDQFSEGFTSYVQNDNKYWWGYSLFRYRWEHPAANGQPVPMQHIPASYYNFLSQLEINDDSAILNIYYQYFVRLYVKFRMENPPSDLLAQIKQGMFIVQSNGLTNIVNSPESNQPVDASKYGDKLKYLYENSNILATKMVDGQAKSGYWYKVRTNNNVVGWVFGGQGRLEGVEAASQPEYKTVTIEEYVPQQVIVTKVDKLRVRRAPSDPNAIAVLDEGTEVTYLGQESPQTYTYTLRDIAYNRPFYKIQTSTGEIGWIFGGGVEIVEKNVKRTIVKQVPLATSKPTEQPQEKPANDIFELFGRLLNGRTLQYALASDIYQRSRWDDSKNLRSDVDRFVASNPYDAYNTIVLEGYNAAQRREMGIARTSQPPKPYRNQKPKQADKTGQEDKPAPETTVQIAKAQALPSKNAPSALQIKAPMMPAIVQMDFSTRKLNSAILAIDEEDLKDEVQTVVIQAKKDSLKSAATTPTIAQTPVEPTTKPAPESIAAQSAPKPHRPTPSKPAPTTAKMQEREKESGIPANILEELDKIGRSPSATAQAPLKPLAPPMPAFVDIDTKPEDRPHYETNVIGRINGARPVDAKVIIYSDPVTYKELSNMLHVQNDGVFNTKVFLAEPVNGQFQYGYETVNIFLEPGDNLSVYFDANSFYKSLYFKGKGSEHNNFLLQLKQKFEAEDKETKRRLETDKPEDFKKFVQKTYRKKLDFLDSYKGKEQFSEGFKSYAQAEIDYWFAYELINYPWEHAILKNLEAPMKMDELYYDFLNDVKISNDGALPNQNYTNFLYMFFSNKEKEKENFGLTKSQMADRYLQGKAKYYYQAKQLVYACQQGRINEIGFDIRQFLEICPYPAYKDALKVAYNENKGLLVGMNAPDFELENDRGQRVRLSDFKGKVVYIDFWATWCQMCINDFPNAARLKESFKGTNVVFINISLDESKETWQNYVRRNPVGGVQLYAGSGSSVAKFYGVQHLPACFLVDKHGKVAQNPAKRPSQPGINDQINSLLLQ
jgi:peroxiredoxin